MSKNACEQRYSKYLDSRCKRCFDITVCMLIFIPASAMIILIGIAALIIEGRPVFFAHYRAGKNGRLFLMPKIRTMHTNANPYKPSQEFENGRFFTITGKFLRRHRLDELPQIFSVLAGQMSLVGPRPELPSVAEKYTFLEKKRLAARPGITGLWQIMGDRKEAMYKGVKYDLYYLRKANFLLDIKILAMTIPFVSNPKPAGKTYENCIYTYNISLPE
jgi:lipopolysaccharide/colanic/teichoic acid biosynthesis glycosyltransferase